MSKHRKLTQAELLAEATERFGDDPMNFAFECPHCGDVATIRDFALEGGDPNRAGQECIGRTLGATRRSNGSVDAYRKKGGRGCDWAAYGLFRGPWEVVVPVPDAMNGESERSIWSFPLAGAR